MKIDAEKLLKEIGKIRAVHELVSIIFPYKKEKPIIEVLLKIEDIVRDMVAEEEQREENKPNYKIDVNLFDEAEIYTDCTVEVLHNSVTDEYSVGWWENRKGARE